MNEYMPLTDGEVIVYPVRYQLEAPYSCGKAELLATFHSLLW